MKQLASKGDVKSARILAREVVRSNKQKDRLSVSKARLGSISNQLAQQMGELNAAGSKLRILTVCRTSSNGESDWITPEIHRNHEAVESAYQAASDQPDNARNEHGDDEGASFAMQPHFGMTSLESYHDRLVS